MGKKISGLSISVEGIEKIYWGILCPKISQIPFDEPMNARIRTIWKKDRTVAGIAKTLYEENNYRHKRDQFYERKNMYTPLHLIQNFLEEEGF
jgi:hypothetical protein